MASDPGRRALGDIDCIGYQEVCELKLSAEHFPISCSLSTRVEEQFANTSGPKDGFVLSLKELLAYIKNPHDLDLTPYADLLHQLDAMGDPGQPSKDHARVLRWVGEALYHYEQRFPVEEPLASTNRARTRFCIGFFSFTFHRTVIRGFYNLFC